MALNTFKCNCLTPLHFKGLNCITTLSYTAVLSYFFFLQWSAVYWVYDIPLLFVALHPSQSSAVLSTSRYLADVVRWLNISSFFLPRNTLPFILPSIISHSKTLFQSTCPGHVSFHCQIVFNMLLSSFFRHCLHLLLCLSNWSLAFFSRSTFRRLLIITCVLLSESSPSLCRI